MFPFEDFRQFLNEADNLGLVRRIGNASCETEIGALCDLLGNQNDSPILLFENIPGFPQGFRIAANWSISPKTCALALGLDPRLSNLELMSAYRKKVTGLKSSAPRVVNHGPVLENVLEGEEVNLLMFPVPTWHAHDGGPYIGTSDLAITKDPDEGWVNVGNYRMMVHDKKTLGIWFASPRRHGFLMAEKYWANGKSCPIAVSFGHEPTTWLVAIRNLPWGDSEYDYSGGLRGKAVDVISGKFTGLPIPATSEIAIEGEIPPPQEEKRMEGPFCEYPGYYAHHGPEFVIRVKRLMFRNNPILLGAPMPRPPYSHVGIPHMAADIWEYLEGGNVPFVKGVWIYGTTFLIVISLKQRFAGHATQALLSAASFVGNATVRYIVAVDDDIDPSKITDVLWALFTRVDPEESMNIVKGTWTVALDPRLTPAKKESGNHTMSICLINACKPFEWQDKYPTSETVEPDVRRQVMKKWSSLFETLTASALG